jgi:putative serine protease PepD
MSSRDGGGPSRSPDPIANTSTQPLPPGGDAAGRPDDETAGDTWPPAAADGTDPAWPPAWGQAPSSGQHATSTRAPSEPQDAGPGWGQPPAAPQDAGPDWSQPPAAPQDAGPDAGWGQGGGGSPTTPGWQQRPAGAGTPGGRRPSRLLVAGVAAVVLLAGGYGIGQALDRDEAPVGAGIPTAAASAPIQAGDEPVAAVAKALLPTVVQIEVDQGGQQGLGSGFVYDKNGYILTAAHVVGNADQVTVRLSDGSRLRGQVVGTDDVNDVAVVKVDRDNLKAAPLAIGVPLQVGQLAVAIGSPFGLDDTVTAGVVSATNRILQGAGREVIQTDAPINRGNSGGLLADREGRVIGINDAIAAGGNGGNVGIGFAIPIDVAAKSAEAIVQGRPVQTGYLGVSMSDPTGGQAGALVQRVEPDSPAAKAGLRVGDLVVAIDGKAVESYDELASQIRSHKPGDKVTLKVVRDGSETEVAATLAQRPSS